MSLGSAISQLGKNRFGKPKQIDIDGLKITLIRSTRRRTLSLEINSNGIFARAPSWLAQKEIEVFIHSKKDWISTQLARTPKMLEPLTLRQGSHIPFNGDQFQIQIHDGRHCIHLNTHNEEKQIIIPISPSHLDVQETIKRKLIRWYRQQALEQFQGLSTKWARQMQPEKADPKIKIRDYKRRWGCCDVYGDISINWRLVMAPLTVQNYVVIHELAHRDHFNHSDKFWNLVARFDPTWKISEQWLNQYGTELYRI